MRDLLFSTASQRDTNSNYAENVLQKSGSEADKNTFLSDFQLAVEAWKENTGIAEEYLSILRRHHLETHQYLRHIKVGIKPHKPLSLLEIPLLDASHVASDALPHLHL